MAALQDSPVTQYLKAKLFSRQQVAIYLYSCATSSDLSDQKLETAYTARHQQQHFDVIMRQLICANMMFPEAPTPLPPISDEYMVMSQHTPQGDELPLLIEKMLEGRQPTDIDLQQLSDVEFAMYMKIKQKKASAPQKRPDELQKMFFKRALKYAEDIFMRKRKTKRMNMFYRHHFAGVAEKLGCSLLNFYHPNKQIKSGNKSGQKTFNTTYVRLILRSSTFMQITRDYLEVFMKDNLKERRKKIKKLIEACRKVVSIQPQPELKPEPPTFDCTMDPELKPDAMLGDIGWAMADEVCQFNWPKPQIPRYAKTVHQWDELEQYLQNSKCKIPWSNRELEEAKKMAVQEMLAIDDGQ